MGVKSNVSALKQKIFKGVRKATMGVDGHSKYFDKAGETLEILKNSKKQYKNIATDGKINKGDLLDSEIDGLNKVLGEKNVSKMSDFRLDQVHDAYKAKTKELKVGRRVAAINSGSTTQTFAKKGAIAGTLGYAGYTGYNNTKDYIDDKKDSVKDSFGDIGKTKKDDGYDYYSY